MSWVVDFVQDARYALRSLRANATLTVVALVTLALGVGANTLVFSALSGILLRPLPYADPDRLVQVNQTSPAFGAMALRNLPDYRDGSTMMTSMAGYVPTTRMIRSPTGLERAGIVLAYRPLFRVLGVSPIAGRTFENDDGVDVLVVSSRFATRHFGSEASAVGRTIDVQGVARTVIGVMSDGFEFPYGRSSLTGTLTMPPIDLWGVLEFPPNPRAAIDFTIGRLRDGVSLEAAREELNGIAERLALQYPESNAGVRIALTPIEDTIVGPVRAPLMALFGAVSLVLVAACANVANILLVRASTRRRELALRTAVGASPLRLVRQQLTESLVLALGGGVVAFALVAWALPLVLSIWATRLPRSVDIGVDWRVFSFLFGVTVVASLGVGLGPALSAVRSDVQTALRGTSGAGGSDRSSRRVRRGLAGAEVALSFMLVMASGLVGREFLRLRQTDTGMTTSRVLTLHVGPNMRAEDVRDLIAPIGALPGVRAAAFTQMLPLQSWGWTATFAIKGRAPVAPADRPVVELRYVTPQYFTALDIPIQRGRAFTESDTATSARVIVINETLARRYLPGVDPVGIETDRGTIVGVAADVRQIGLDAATLPDLYYPIAQNVAQLPDLGLSLVVRTDVPPGGLAGPIRDVVQRTRPALTVFGVRTMDEIVADSMWQTTLYTRLVGSFAVLTLLIAVAGVYGVMAHDVASRTHEFGVRQAVGASPGSIGRLVLRQATVPVGGGLLIGLAGTIASARVLDSLVAGAGRIDVAPIALASAVLLMAALVACLVPARRAARVDPLRALRQD